jgi:formylglycine-generating enzyme required for sulfatase activity
MSHIFISYSRKDLELARPIVAALAKDNLDIWIDWEDIPKGEEFYREIYQGIEEADAFLFLVSPDACQSEWCNREISHAVENGKRILPIVIRDTDPKDVHPEISKRNWIFCRDGQDDFSQAIEKTRETIHTDYGWLKYHTKLQVKALDWEKHSDRGRLLRGKELIESEQRLAGVGDLEPQPTNLQQLYVTRSRELRKKIRSWIISSIAIALILVLGFAAWPGLSMERAVPGKWVEIPDGKFTMGMNQDEAEDAEQFCKDGSLPGTVDFCWSTEFLLAWSGRLVGANLSKYLIMDNEVTNAQYMQCVDNGGCVPPDGWGYESVDINKPATGLDWSEAMSYCGWLNGRLPTEGEWEKAARGPNQTYFPWGDYWDPLKPQANLENFTDGGLQSISAYAATDHNEYDVSNMAGNVMEWTDSISIPHVAGDTFSDPELKVKDIDQVVRIIVRGGAWGNPRSSGMASHRGELRPSYRNSTLGFRCACPIGRDCKSPWSWWWIWSHDYYPDQ